MTRSSAILRLVLGLSLCLLLAVQGCARNSSSAARGSAALNGLQPGFAQMRDARGDFTMTIFPVMVPDTPSPTSRVEFARAVALVLERTGLKSLDVSEKAFAPKSTDPKDLDALSSDFSRSVREKAIKTDYAYFTEFFGTPETGATAILTVVVDRQGQIVWKKRQGPDDRDFRRFAPREPLSCAYVSVEPFSRSLGLGDPTAKNAYRGRWDAYFAAKVKQERSKAP
jgi:hypothetical protein